MSEKKYEDSKGKPQTLWSMLTREPGWVVSRFQHMETELARLKTALAAIEIAYKGMEKREKREKRAKKAEAVVDEITGARRPREAIMKTGEMVSERNALKKEVGELKGNNEKLKDAYQILRDMPTSHMKRGAGCPICIAQGEAFAKAKELVDAAEAARSEQ